jgi:acylphosphatase
MNPAAHSVCRLAVRGQVQGVGYRYSLVCEATRLGVRGWVRNRREGWVEALVAGPPDAVQRLITWARRGPPAAVVASVQVLLAEGEVAEGLQGFEQRPTV